MCARAALWCALVLVAGAHAYTIDCNHEYTDCDTELSKLTGEEDETALASHAVTTAVKITEPPPRTSTDATAPPTRSTAPPTTESTTESEVEAEAEPETTPEDDITTTESSSQSPRARLLNLSVDDLKNFAITLHNQTELTNKKLTDLSDVTLDEDEFDPSKIEFPKEHQDLPAKFYSNLQAPFPPMVTPDHSDEARDDATCGENGINYKVGDQVNRSCEETCVCTSTGTFSCSPRCKHPYVRRGRHISDPLCFESPVDECCSIIACATGNGEMKVTKLEVCKYGNDTYLVGNSWNVGCEQRCTCEKNSVVTCKPRCPPLAQSDKCINVQDPNDACCEVQVCDVSQDVHEDQTDNATMSNTTAAAEKQNLTEAPPMSTTLRPLVLAEPIGSIKVLQNNTVQVTLMHSNSSEDPIHLLISDDGGVSFKDTELKFDNLILNLDGGKDYILKTKETGTKFNFTITAMDMDKMEEPEELVEVNKKIGCHQDGNFYEVGEEFHIGCTSLCECTGDETRECAALECPSHVGLELMSKGCVRWAPSPPPTPPNCCPRAARCLSDGTCHFNGVPIPNWTDVPISLSGCEQRCFCENGELDCQEVCSPLPPLPPQTMRCPPGHRPAPVNISDDDCCKQWGCLPNAGNEDDIHSDTTPMYNETPVTVAFPPRNSNPTDEFHRRHQGLTKPKPFLPTITPLKEYISDPEDYESSENLTVFNFEHFHVPYDSDEPLEFNNHSHFENGGSPDTEPLSDNNYSFFPLKPVIVPKQPIYKFIHNSLPDNRTPPTPNVPRNKDMSIKHVTKPQESLSKVQQTIFFTPASKKTNQLTQNIMQPKIHDVPPASQVKPVKNYSVHNPERFELPIPTSKPGPLQIETNDRTHGRLMTPLHSLPKPKQMTDKNRWDQNTKLHVLTKSPNPYENVLLRAVPGLRAEPSFLYNRNHAAPTKAYSALDLENLLSQMEVESEANRNLERSAEKVRSAGQAPPEEASTQPQVPKAPFLPTVPPFQFPPDEDYGQNDIHRPVNSLVPGISGLPPGITGPPSFGENKKLTVITLMSDSPTSVKMLFGLPPVLVGLRGSVDLRYTDKADEEITHWYSQVFAPADEILTTSRLEFRLTGLKPSTVYKMRGKLYLHNLPVEPESEIYSIRTQDLPTVEVYSLVDLALKLPAFTVPHYGHQTLVSSTSSKIVCQKVAPLEVKRRVVNSSLKIQDVNDTVAHISWRRFTEDDLQFIDAIQVRYRPKGNPIYSMTELLHHSRDSVLLHELRPGSRYEASLVLVPPPRATTELHDPAVLEFNTAPYVDPYNWNVVLEVRSVGSEAAELTWRGVPAPAERWVRVYRAAHACGAARREHDAFRLVTRDLPPAITLTQLLPDTRCRVWLELFLTNGKVKTSNVLEINTKSLDSPEPIDNAIEASSVGGSRTAPRGDYYGALVVVGVVAALGALTSLLLLLVVVRRHRPRSVPITPVPTAPRESSLPPYDNPAYKLELQQETMDL